MEINPPQTSTILNQPELQRITLKSQKIRSYIFLGAGVIIFGALFLIGCPLEIILIIALIPLLIGIYLSVIISPKEQEYQHNFKQSFVASAIQRIDQSLKIEPAKGLSEAAFIDSRLFSRRPDRYHSEDQIYGTAGKTRFSFSEVHAEYKTVTHTKNGRREHWHTILKGIIFCADFNKNFHGTTIVSPNGIGNMIGSWITNAIPVFSNDELVKLEDPDFSKNFITYSNDQVEARYILTPKMMERICKLNDRCSQTISLSFTADHVFIAFPLDKNYFEAPIFKSLLDPNLFEEDIAVIKFMYDIIHEFDLNTRIWGKS